LAYPLIFLLVGFLFIPVVMRLDVTSAYEILEQRLGLGVRLLGSGVFILMRLAWMAAIIYVTTAAIVIPILGLNPQWAPWIGVILGVRAADVHGFCAAGLFSS
jgi:Na+/proline symporter